MVNSTVASRLAAVESEIRTAQAAAQDKTSEPGGPLILVAVSKKQPTGKIQQAFAGGQINFAESYLQEAVPKIGKLTDLPIVWHFIGPLQSNKCRQVAQHFDWVQSVDRAKLLTKLSQYASEYQRTINVCLQVNAFGESRKSGAHPDELVGLAALTEQLPGLVLRGLMAIPPRTEEYQVQFEQFSTLAQHYRDLATQHTTMDTLSLGMSGDFQAAIAAGSNMLRIGTAIFGRRET